LTKERKHARCHDLKSMFESISKNYSEAKIVRAVSGYIISTLIVDYSGNIYYRYES
jgi:hypothetical protein